MNVDVKILHKIWANEIQQCIENVLHHDLMGFTPGMQGWYNLHKSIHMLHNINKMKD